MLYDDATLVPATGHFFFNPTPGAARPTNPAAPAQPWVDLGNTSEANPLSITSSGGDTTTLATWQNPSLRNSHSPRVESVAFTLQQWDLTTMQYYFGANADVSTGRLRVSNAPTETNGALFVRVDDGSESLAIYFPSVSLYRDADISFDAAALAGMPVRATILGYSGNNWMYEIDPKTNLNVQSLAVTPTTSAKASGSTTQLTTTATLTTAAGGGTKDVTALASYSSSDTTKATVSSTGLITMVATGTATITVKYGEQSGTCAVTVS